MSERAERPAVLERWHRIVEEQDTNALDAILADDAVFHSPIVHTPQRGKALTRLYLMAAMQVLANEHFRYVGEWYGRDSAVLEFRSSIDGIEIDGIDMISWDATGRIVEFKVMVRPLKAINLLHDLMRRMLAGMPARSDAGG
jgi:hypothetical protein